MTFDFFLGGYFRDRNYRIRLQKGMLHILEYQVMPFPEEEKIITVADNKYWPEVLEFLKGCNWKKVYDSDMLDGTQWELKVKGEGMLIKSYGSNAYPDNFDAFLALLNKVAASVGITVA